MMRHPIDNLPYRIDPWGFAKARRCSRGDILIAATQVIKQWCIVCEDTLHAQIAGEVDEYHQPHLSGHVAVALEMQCQRCLEKMPLSIARDFDYVIIREQSQEAYLEGDVESFICSEDELDVVWFLEEEILLAIPMIVKHDNCELPQVVAVADEIIDGNRQYPFAALKEMIKSKEN